MSSRSLDLVCGELIGYSYGNGRDLHATGYPSNLEAGYLHRLLAWRPEDSFSADGQSPNTLGMSDLYSIGVGVEDLYVTLAYLPVLKTDWIEENPQSRDLRILALSYQF